MTGHIHAELIAQYAEDAKVSKTPWEFWQEEPPFGEHDGITIRRKKPEWRYCGPTLCFHPSWKYRRKPKTVTINGFEVVDDSLKALVSEQLVQKTEVAGRKIIFYIESLSSNETYGFEFQIRALYPVRAEGATSSAYEYYDSTVTAYDRLEGMRIVSRSVRPRARRESVRPPGRRMESPN